MENIDVEIGHSVVFDILLSLINSFPDVCNALCCERCFFWEERDLIERFLILSFHNFNTHNIPFKNLIRAKNQNDVAKLEIAAVANDRKSAGTKTFFLPFVSAAKPQK